MRGALASIWRTCQPPPATRRLISSRKTINYGIVLVQPSLTRKTRYDETWLMTSSYVRLFLTLAFEIAFFTADNESSNFPIVGPVYSNFYWTDSIVSRWLETGGDGNGRGDLSVESDGSVRDLSQMVSQTRPSQTCPNPVLDWSSSNSFMINRL